MIKVKLCGLTRDEDIAAVNSILPDYIGFVFFEKSKRFVSREQAKKLKEKLDAGIKAVGVFVDEEPEKVAELLSEGIIDIAQLHGNEDDDYISRLKALTDRPLIKAFRIRKEEDVSNAIRSTAELILLDAGAGDGKSFDWSWLKDIERPFFLAGGLDTENVYDAVSRIRPFAVDTSSGIESEGLKDPDKMKAFTDIVRSVTDNG